MLIKLITFLLATTPFLLAQQPQPTIDTNNFLGCYINDRSAHEFNTFASHLDETQLTPTLCIRACASMFYKMAAIEDGTKCFCKSTTTVLSVITANSNCQLLACAGSTTTACGSTNNIMVYNVSSITPLQVNIYKSDLFLVCAKFMIFLK
jgi:hypothetical protein